MSSNNQQQLTDQATVFGPGCQIKGEVAVQGDAAVLGAVQGTVQVSGALEIAEGGEINGDVTADSMRVQGHIQGDVLCDGLLELNGKIEGDVVCGKVDLGSNATLVGNLRAKIISVREGAIYRGEVIIGPEAMDGSTGQSTTNETTSAGNSSGGHGNGNGQHHEPKSNAQPRTAVSGLLRKRHEMLNT
jgi:cytoskeletal protein CcmA (bactofilin family)